MNKLFKTSFFAFMAIAVVFGMTGCGGETTEPPIASEVPATPITPATSVPEEEVVVIHGLHQFSPGAGFQVEIQALTDEFNASHPNIQVEWDWAGYETYFTKLQAGLESNNPPDMLYRAGIRDLGMDDYYLNLTPYMNEPSYDDANILWKDTFPASIVGEGGLYWLEGVPQGSGIYGVPNEFIVEGVFYNKDLFEQNNIVIPKTYDEFITVCQTLKAAGIAPVLQDNDQGYNANIFIELAGMVAGEEAFLEAASGTGTFDTPDFIEAARLTQNFAKECFQDAWTGYQYPAAQTMLASGGGSMNINGSWLPSELASALPDNFRIGFFRVPPVTGGKGTPNQMQSIINGYVVLKATQHPAEVVEYLKFLSSKDAVEKVAAQGNLMARIGATVPARLADVPAVIADSHLVSRAFGTYEDFQEWYIQVSWKYGDLLIIGSLTPEEAMKQLDQATKEYWANQ